MKTNQMWRPALLAAVTASSISAFASGYEKSVYWSGKYSGVAGAATGSVSGAESLFFNPAGLAGARSSPGDVSVNFSPTWVHYNSPPAQDYQSQQSNTRLVPVYGVMASYQLMPKLTVGLGNYVVGGNKANYENISFASVTTNFSSFRPSTRGDLDVIENALGVGYEVVPGLKVGATWRVTQVNASLYSTKVGAANSSLLGLRLDDLKDTRWNGYKVGLQYTAKDESFGLGASYRSQVIFNANGNSSGQVLVPGVITTPTAITGGRVAVRSMLPAQAIFGGFYHFKEQKLKVMTQYEFTNYSKVQQLDFTGSITLPAPVGTTTNLGTTPIELRYKDQHLVRLGGEYEMDENCVLRAGYSWTSRVTSPGYSLTTFFPAAPSHSIFAGYGHKFSDRVEFNVAGEYMFSTATVTPEDVAAASSTTQTQPGQYKVRVLALHTGVVFKF